MREKLRVLDLEGWRVEPMERGGSTHVDPTRRLLGVLEEIAGLRVTSR